ncbi:MAG: GTPase ObgE [Prevotella sp.]|nr:GTPase ObgE [Prevotella sp.]
MFVDNVEITIQAGAGGTGAATFYRDTLTMFGGPNGGDGGRGGDVIFVGTNNLNNLVDFHYHQKFKAGDGANGQGGNKTGADGQDAMIPVPLGTKILDENGKLLCDITTIGQKYLALKGGAGGFGNTHFATAARQTPNFSKAGVKTKPYRVRLELNCIADIGIIGYPNVGKSTLLSVISRARPKIANYQFTTLYPNIGVAQVRGQNLLFADIPGLIEGASDGVGLGIDFLKHIARTRLLLHVIDIAATEGREPYRDYQVINQELKRYHADLENKQQIVVLNKIDSATTEQINTFKAKLDRKIPVFEISAINHTGLQALLDACLQTLNTIPKPEPLLVEAVLEQKVDKNQFTVTGGNGEYQVTGAFIENLIRGVVLDDTESNRYFQRRLVQNGVIEQLKNIGMVDGDTIQIAGHFFTYTE